MQEKDGKIERRITLPSRIGRKRLIINADDFGLHESINNAVAAAHKEGILTSASIMANGEGFDHAIEIAKKNRGLGIGVHLVLNGEEPVAPRDKIFSILDDGGRLMEDHKKFCMDILLRKINLKHIAIECDAQIGKCLSAGLRPTHVNSHRHLHLFPPIFKALRPVLEKHGLSNIRWINTPWYEYHKMDPEKIAFLIMLQCTKLSKCPRYRHADYFVGFFSSGFINEDYLKDVMDKLGPGITEINCHPATDDTFLRERYSSWEKRYNWPCNNWRKEFEALLSADVKERIRLNKISLVSYADI